MKAMQRFHVPLLIAFASHASNQARGSNILRVILGQVCAVVLRSLPGSPWCDFSF